MWKKIDSVMDWIVDHFVWIFGTLVASELLYKLEDHLNRY